MTIYDQVKDALPVNLYDFQVDTVNELGPLKTAGYYLAAGTGKTLTSIAACVHKLRTGQIKTVICVMPPVLLTNWSRTLSSIEGVTHVIYRGSPKERDQIDLDADFVLVGYQIFKKDFARFERRFTAADNFAVLCDEAQAIKNPGSDNYKKVRDLSAGQHLLLLTGTPLSIPLDGYVYCNLVAPGMYRSYHQFCNIHVAERDFFDKPIKFANLDLLAENMRVNAKFITQRDALKDLPEVTYTPIFYDLDPAHKKLYKQLAEEQLIKFDNGEKLDLTNVTALIHALSQVPMNAEHFSGGKIKSTGLDLLDEIMDELGDRKLVVFTYYKMTNRSLIKHCSKYNAVALYGEISAKEKQAALDRFVNDPGCRLILLQTLSGSAGIDHLQDVCNDMLFLENSYNPIHFEQGVARVLRSGQTLPVNVRIAIANDTIQKYIMDVVLNKDDILGVVQRGSGGLRSAIFGR